MFQTPRPMAFAYGAPLHYFLQSRRNCAPRWTLVSAGEIAQVEVLYGPFSAEYSGNAMGGVVLIETAIPQERRFRFEASHFSQSFDDYGFDGTVNGYKAFASYGDKIGDLSLYFSYNHLDNESQPQSFYHGADNTAADPAPVTGAIAGNDEFGDPRLFFGDSGITDTTTDNFKFKSGYEAGDWFTLLNVAYEDRRSDTQSPHSYVRDDNGNPVWGGDVVQNGRAFHIPPGRLNVSEADRRSLSVGLRVRGDLTEAMSLEANINEFDILEDEDRSSALNPAHPDYTPAGQVVDFGDTGWQTAGLKLSVEDLGVKGLNLVTGTRYEAYELNTNVYASDNWTAGRKDRLRDASGGETNITAWFAQLNWDISPAWDLSLGGRHEAWESRNGYFADDDPATPALENETVPARSKDAFSPKCALGYKPSRWTLRYSLARAYRFPIDEELFSQFRAFNAVNEANPELEPEAGLHHNVMVERALEQGYVRVNVFSETVEDVIQAQSATLPGGTSVRTFIPVDKVRTRGVEFIANASNLFVDDLDVRFNTTYTDSEIVENTPDPSIEGNTFPRMPDWRANLLATYHMNNRWDIGGNIQYASDSFGRLDNTDDEDNVFGAQDGYTRLGLKTVYRLTDQARISAGVDNLTDEIAYVAHPWPGRTYYVNVSYQL
jgi:iron complex outermembrane receptor protein